MLIRIPGSVWHDYLDPLATAMHDELGLSDYRPEIRNVGKGTQHIYDVPAQLAGELADYLDDRAEVLIANEEPEYRAVHRRALRLAEQIRREMNEGDRPR